MSIDDQHGGMDWSARTPRGIGEQRDVRRGDLSGPYEDGMRIGAREAAEEQVRMVMANREAYVAAWVAATGVHPTEAQMVIREEWDGFNKKTTITIERKP